MIDKLIGGKMENMTLPDLKGADISVIVAETIASGCQRDFRGIYDSLPERRVVKAPKSAFVDRIAAITMKHPNTVRCWLAGTQKPDALSRAMIEKELKVPSSELFPED